MGSCLSSLWRQAFSAFSALLPSSGGESLSQSTHKSGPPSQGTNPGGAGPSQHNNAGGAPSQNSEQEGRTTANEPIKPELKFSSGPHMSDGGEQPNDPPSYKSPSENITERYDNYDTEIYRGTILCRCCATRVPRERPSIQPCRCSTVCEECAFGKYAGDKICPACGTEMSSEPKMIGRFQSLRSL